MISTITNSPIDLVYTYVNYNDPNWYKSYNFYSNKKTYRTFSLNELELSVNFTLKHCDFIRKIYIITDNQIPYWYDKCRVDEK